MRVESKLLPDWETFKSDYVDSGVPLLFVVRPNPLAALFLDEGGTRFGAKFRINETETTLPRPLEELRIETVFYDGARYLEVWTQSRELFPNFYKFAADVISDVSIGEKRPSVALAQAIQNWDALLSRKSILSEERQAGLFGELWLLKRLIGAIGESSAVEAWVGPSGQAHDFRIDKEEFEVKTTSGRRRVHTINGLGQLQPSPQCRLFVLSLQLADGGVGGLALEQFVEEISKRLVTAVGEDRFWSALGNIGYNTSDAKFYNKRRKLRDAAVLVPILDGIPRLTSEAIGGLPRGFAPERILRVSYDVDFTGFGFVDGTQEFHSIIPPSSDGDSS